MWYIEVEYDDGQEDLRFYDTREEARLVRKRIYHMAERSFISFHPYTVKVSVPKKAD